MCLVVVVMMMIPCTHSFPMKQVKHISKRGLTDPDCYGTECEWDPDYKEHFEVNLPENVTITIMSVLPGIEGSQKNIVMLLNQILVSMGSLVQLMENQFHDPSRKCQEILQSAELFPRRQYSINPMDRLGPLKVFCDMETDGGGWTVFQRRFDGSVNFYRSWQDYENGFGSVDGEYWLGLRNIFRLTRNQQMVLRIDMESFDGDTAYAVYDSFAIGDASSKYQLTVGTYVGTAGDSLKYHNGMKFSTRGRDNDIYSGRHCAEKYRGAWWYRDCFASNLNGMYVNAPGDSRDLRGMIWKYWKGFYKSVKSAEMKMRPA